MTARRAGCVAGVAMLLVYLATLAPGVTFWDAGEFIAAARTLGIPHPPGTPLFVLLLNSWARLLPFLPFAMATNSFSAVSTALAVGAIGFWVARATSAPWAGVAAAIVAGGMSSVWQNATETEVYAAALLLAVGAILAADEAGRTGEQRWTILAAYFLVLSLPLHLSAIVAAPVVIYLATASAGGTRDWSSGATLAGASAVAIGVSRLSLAMPVCGLVLIAIAPFISRMSSRAEARREQAISLGAVLLAASALFILLVRAQHDPGINQANPVTLDRLAYTIARRQYDLQGLWPRQAPFWLQLGNWFEYADWQFALSLAPTVIPTPARIAFTIVFAVLGFAGGRWHWQRDRRTAIAVGLLLLCGSLGVIVYLNLKVGSSFGWQFVPDEAHHEARDRDYFFVLGFWAWGLWAGMGALVAGRWIWVTARRRVTRLRRLPRATAWCTACGLVIAALPVALNWSAVDRGPSLESGMPVMVAHALLDPLPQRAVLFVAGDNDTYPLWYAQRVEHLRPDVTVITMPLLGARWYSEELGRRDGLQGPTADRIAASARTLGRPVAVSLTVPPEDRNPLAISWTVLGDVALDSYSLGPSKRHLRVISIDSAAVAKAAAAIEAWRRGRTPRPAVDPVHDYFAGMLTCPTKMLESRPGTAQLASLDSLCNLR